MIIAPFFHFSSRSINDQGHGRAPLNLPGPSPPAFCCISLSLVVDSSSSLKIRFGVLLRSLSDSAVAFLVADSQFPYSVEDFLCGLGPRSRRKQTSSLCVSCSLKQQTPVDLIGFQKDDPNGTRHGEPVMRDSVG